MKCSALVTITSLLAMCTLPAQAQDLNGANLTLSGTITQNDFGQNYFASANNTFDGRACIGPSCDGTEPVEQGPLRLKWSEPNLLFEDSSTAIGVSSNDWRLVVNDFTETFFAVEDIDGGTIPFMIAGGVPTNSLYLSSSGNIGFGTSLPQEALHVTGGTPNLRFEDVIGTTYRWDVGGNHINFFVEDATANRFPFIIAPGAPTNSIYIAGSGGIGMGTDLPSTGLHVQKSDGTGAILIEETSAGTLGQMTLRNNGITFFTLEDTSIAAGKNTGRAWNFQNQNGTFRVTTAPGGPGEIEMVMTPAGDMTIKGSLTTGGGTCGGGCDAVFSDEYDLPSIAEHAEAMWSLGHLPNVGPTVENAPINVSDKLGRMLNELEHAHIYIGQLHDRLSENETEKADLRAIIADQNTRLARLEAAVTALSVE